MKIFFAVFCSLIILDGYSQNYFNNIGATSYAMGGTGVATSDLWSANNNQAGLANLESFSAGFFYSNNFMLKTLSQNSAVIAMPTKSGVFGLSLNYFGYSSFNNKKIGFAFGKKISPNISAGVQLDYVNTYITNNYGSGNFFTFEVGLMAKLTNKITLGAHVFNPLMIKISDYQDERMPAVLNLGMQYKPTEKLRALLEVESDIYNSPIIKAGAEYHPTEMLFILAGISNNPNVWSFGFGLKFNYFKLEFSSTMHQVLGYSPQFSLVYNPIKSK